eukprot:scaffold9745_cov112-Isochrysis_galbana.AAC.3
MLSSAGVVCRVTTVRGRVDQSGTGSARRRKPPPREPVGLVRACSAPGAECGCARLEAQDVAVSAGLPAQPQYVLALRDVGQLGLTVEEGVEAEIRAVRVHGERSHARRIEAIIYPLWARNGL